MQTAIQIEETHFGVVTAFSEVIWWEREDSAMIAGLRDNLGYFRSGDGAIVFAMQPDDVVYREEKQI